MDLKDVVNGAVGSFDDHCAGYLNPGASGLGYIATLKLATGLVKHDMDDGLEGIVSYDRAEKNGSYIGQINMLTASSFCGLNGAVWGYDLANNLGAQPLFTQARHDQARVPVYDAEPLLDAATRLFGTARHRRFPPLPGAMVICANKSATRLGPTTVWCALALSIAEDRNKNACLFIEDADFTTGDRPLPDPDEYRERVTRSILRCGADQNVKFKEIFIGFKSLVVPEGHVGCSLTCAPYVTLAKKAVPKGKKPEDLLSMSLEEWESQAGFSRGIAED